MFKQLMVAFLNIELELFSYKVQIKQKPEELF